MSTELRLGLLLLAATTVTASACANVVETGNAGGAGGAGGAQTTSGYPATTTAVSTGTGTSTGACTDGNDLALYNSEQVFNVVVKCASMYLGSNPQETQCIEMNTGLSAMCSTCVDDYIQCIKVNCFNPCVSGPMSQTCHDCRKASCGPGFSMCSGLPLGPGE